MRYLKELNTPTALELVPMCHLGPRTCKIEIWHPKLVKLCHLGPYQNLAPKYLQKRPSILSSSVSTSSNRPASPDAMRRSPLAGPPHLTPRAARLRQGRTCGERLERRKRGEVGQRAVEQIGGEVGGAKGGGRGGEERGEGPRKRVAAEVEDSRSRRRARPASGAGWRGPARPWAGRRRDATRPTAPQAALSQAQRDAAGDEDHAARRAAAAVRFSAKAHSVWRSSEWQGTRSRGRGGSCQEEKW